VGACTRRCFVGSLSLGQESFGAFRQRCECPLPPKFLGNVGFESMSRPHSGRHKDGAATQHR